MKDDFSLQFFTWADSNNVTREVIAEELGNSPQTVSTWRSIGIPKGKRFACQALMDKAREKKMEELRGSMILHPTHKQFQQWNKAALQEGKTIEDWAFEGLETMAEEFFSSKKVTPLPKKKAHIQAAAGSEIEAEIIDWEEGSKELNVRIVGDSFTPLYHDGDIVTMAPRHLAKRVELAKGKYYLFRTGDGLKIKRYNTRKARPDERDEDYLTKYGTVGIFESLNSTKHPPEDITTPDVDWLAWLEKDGSYPKDIN